MECNYDDLMLRLRCMGVVILIFFFIFIFFCINEIFSKEQEVKKYHNHILISFTGKEKCPVYIEKDGIITCIYNPARETH